MLMPGLKKLACRANRLLLVKCYENKKVKLPSNWVIFPWTHPEVANQQQQQKNRCYQLCLASIGVPSFARKLCNVALNLVLLCSSTRKVWEPLIYASITYLFSFFTCLKKNMPKKCVWHFVSILKLKIINMWKMFEKNNTCTNTGNSWDSQFTR